MKLNGCMSTLSVENFTVKILNWYEWQLASFEYSAFTYFSLKIFCNSLDAYSSNIELLASNKAFLLGLLNAAAVPIGDLGSTPPSKKQ